RCVKLRCAEICATCPDFATLREETVQDRLDLGVPGLKEKRPGTAVALGADHVEAGLARREVGRFDRRDGEAVGDVRERAPESEAAFGRGRDLERELGEELEVGAVTDQRDGAI